MYLAESYNSIQQFKKKKKKQPGNLNILFVLLSCNIDLQK